MSNDLTLDEQWKLWLIIAEIDYGMSIMNLLSRRNNDKKIT